MASSSVQAVESAKSYYEKNKAAVEEKMEDVKSLLLTNKAQEKPSAMTFVGTTNETGWPLMYAAHEDWTGKVYGSYPKVIEFGGRAGFVHATELSPENEHSDKAAIVYATGDTAYGCLIAWSTTPTTPGTRNKVYVEAGLIENLTKWDHIKARLEESSDMSYYLDTSTETEMFAIVKHAYKMAELFVICAKKYS